MTCQKLCWILQIFWLLPSRCSSISPGSSCQDFSFLFSFLVFRTFKVGSCNSSNHPLWGGRTRRPNHHPELWLFVFCSPNISASKWPEVNKDHPFLVRTHFWNFPFFSRKLIIFVRFLFLLSKVGKWNSYFSFSSRKCGNRIQISLSLLESGERKYRFLFLLSKLEK